MVLIFFAPFVVFGIVLLVGMRRRIRQDLQQMHRANDELQALAAEARRLQAK